MAEDINFFNLDVEFNVVDEILGDPLLVERPRYPALWLVFATSPHGLLPLPGFLSLPSFLPLFGFLQTSRILLRASAASF